MHARIDRLYEGLAQLFEEISTFLKTFKIYKRIEKFAEVDPELKAITGRLMISFVDICALSIKLLSGSKWRKFKTVLKVALMDDDSGIRAELDKFKGLIDQSSRISDAVTLEKVMVSHHEVVELLQDASEKSGQQLLYLEGITSGVNVLKADMNEHKSQRLHSDQIQQLMKKLSINQETAKFSMKYLDDIRTTTPPILNSGLWLKDMKEYNAWADNASSAISSLLLLFGGEKSGKSFLMGSIIDELEFQCREGRTAENRISIAYYCFSKLDKKLETSKSIKNPQLPATALKSMAIRIAEQNISYSKEISSFWATKKATDYGNMPCHELWKSLQLSAPKADTMHYLMFDGLELLSESDARELFEVLLSVQNPRVRILAAADEVSLEASLIPLRDRLANTPSIRIEFNNGLDIGLFIDNYLARNGELFGQDTETSKLKCWLRENLPGLANGNFYRLQTALDKFAEDYQRGQSASDIMQALETADLSQDPTAAAQQIVDRLNKSLNSQEIEYVNEILMWAIYGFRWLEVDQVRAALYLRFKSDAAQPLAAQLSGKGKYEPLFTIENGYVATRDNVETQLQKNAHSDRTEDGDGEGDKPKISMVIKIKNADVQTVQRFLWDLGERVVFEKFAFENIEAKVDAQKGISVHQIEAHIKISLQCMDLLLAEPNDATDALVDYALNYLPAHLERLTGEVRRGKVHRSEIQSIVDKLINLVSDTECIEKHFFKGENRFNFGLPVFSWWLNLPDNVDFLRPRDRRWLERRDNTRNPKMNCLSDIASMVAEHWLRRRDWAAVAQCAAWIYDFITMVSMSAHGYVFS